MSVAEICDRWRNVDVGVKDKQMGNFNLRLMGSWNAFKFGLYQEFTI